MGQPTKCTPEVTEEIRKIVAAGNYMETACDYVGISRQSHYNWMRDGEAAWEEVGGDVEAIDDPSRRAWAIYFDTTRRAEAQAEIRNVSLIQQAAQGPVEGDTRNAMWWLEKRKQHTWGERRVKTELSGPDGGPLEVEHGVDPDIIAGAIDNMLAGRESVAEAGVDELGEVAAED